MPDAIPIIRLNFYKNLEPLIPGAVEPFIAVSTLNPSLRKMSREKWQENDLVFPSDVGTPIGGDRITHEFPVLAKMAGLPVIRLHDCRHTAASIMLSHGIPPIIVAGRLGHSLAILRPAMLAMFPAVCSLSSLRSEYSRDSG